MKRRLAGCLVVKGTREGTLLMKSARHTRLNHATHFDQNHVTLIAFEDQ